MNMLRNLISNTSIISIRISIIISMVSDFWKGSGKRIYSAIESYLLTCSANLRGFCVLLWHFFEGIQIFGKLEQITLIAAIT